jgi:hypothetical protein
MTTFAANRTATSYYRSAVYGAHQVSRAAPDVRDDYERELCFVTAEKTF